MKKYLSILFLSLLPSTLYAGEWIAVDGGVVEIKLKAEEVENKLWLYIKKASTRKFETRDKYTYQYKAINNKEIYINALCDTFGEKSLHKEFVMVDDGGSCFFQINYNFKTGKFSKLQVNGEA